MTRNELGVISRFVLAQPAFSHDRFHCDCFQALATAGTDMLTEA